METLRRQIAFRLEQTFARRGFAAPGVAELKDAAGVSLRTLYRHFPSRDAMVIGALDHRHARYLDFLDREAPPPGPASIAHLFGRLDDWMRENASNGCLFVNALSAHPDNTAIRDAVAGHKREIRAVMGDRAGHPGLADRLFLLHEGATAAWSLLGTDAVRAARDAALALFDGETR